MEWIFPDGISEENILSYEGFVYQITNKKSGKSYIGKKFIYSRRKRLVNKKVKFVRSISDWQTYTGSCVPLNQDIQTLGARCFEKKILSVHRSRKLTNYHELKLQIELDVLTARSGTDYQFYNGNIASKFFRKDFL